jgi:hypothetical protein
MCVLVLCDFGRPRTVVRPSPRCSTPPGSFTYVACLPVKHMMLLIGVCVLAVCSLSVFTFIDGASPPPPVPSSFVQFNSIDCSPSNPSKCCAVGEVRHVLLEPAPSGTALSCPSWGSLSFASLSFLRAYDRHCARPCVFAGIPRWVLLRLSHSLHPGWWLHMVRVAVLMCVCVCVCVRALVRAPLCVLVCAFCASTSLCVSLRVSVCVCNAYVPCSLPLFYPGTARTGAPAPPVPSTGARLLFSSPVFMIRSPWLCAKTVLRAHPGRDLRRFLVCASAPIASMMELRYVSDNEVWAVGSELTSIFASTSHPHAATSACLLHEL